jgi:hypothetical protein
MLDFFVLRVFWDSFIPMKYYIFNIEKLQFDLSFFFN